ncbi:hypothetical protein SAMN04489727_4057 [Amycolatopsis tolypomycina]|uniref:Uncharacterized protein n=1 Tax=Amycolatopsis tolypomycina TaxID=208445 RepID=A0A1H4T776_9PSEU|nr:hypothetical protein [Amycolatopsis tolypomycina]SEC52217.1 hypothetical protein SAMN04489727_4057 [Amycolatopsis tolypomycina]
MARWTRLPRAIAAGYSRSWRQLTSVGERHTDVLPALVLVSAVVAVPVTGLVRLLQTFTVTSPDPVTAVLGVLPGALLSVAGLGAVLWAFGNVKQAATRAYGVGLLASVLTPLLTIEATAGVVTVLWRHGALAARPGSGPGLWASERYFVWHALDAVPFLEIEDTFAWPEPAELSGTAAGTIVVALKVVLLLPMARLLVSAYWWVRNRESTLTGEDFGDDVAALPAVWTLLLALPAYAGAWFLWPPESPLARWLRDHVPQSVDVARVRVPLGWVLPAAQWLVLAVLLVVCGFFGLWVITAAFFRHNSAWWALVAVAGVLLWAHLALVLTASAVLLSVRSGIAAAVPPLPADAPVTVGVGDQLWGFANAVPGLDITQTTHWTRRHVFTGWPVGVLTLGFRLAALFAVLGLVWLVARLPGLVRPRAGT